jgi:hypothetical protein
MARRARFLIGLALAAFGVVMIFSPLEVADVLGRPPASKPALINLRASWGGAVLGLGAFLAWLPALRPWSRTLIGLLGWTMAGVGAARLVGFVVDGGPDGRQWVWLIAEVLIAASCAFMVRGRRR